MFDNAVRYCFVLNYLVEEDANFKQFLSRDEWNKFERMTRFLKPFNGITTLFSRTNYATTDYIFMECLKLNWSYMRKWRVKIHLLVIWQNK